MGIQVLGLERDTGGSDGVSSPASPDSAGRSPLPMLAVRKSRVLV